MAAELKVGIPVKEVCKISSALLDHYNSVRGILEHDQRDALLDIIERLQDYAETTLLAYRAELEAGR